MPKDSVAAAQTSAEVLRCFAELGSPLALTTISAHTAIQPGKVHRYLRSFIMSGMLVQNVESRAYDLGPLAFSLGIAALRRYEIVRGASERLTEFCHESGESASLLVWGTGGPIVIRAENSHKDIVVVLRVGATVKLTTSSAGRVFAAFLDKTVSAPFLDAEYAAPSSGRFPMPSRSEFQSIVAEVRKSGLAVIEDGPIAGVAAISAPLTAPDGRVAAVVSAIGQKGSIDLKRHGAVARELTRFIASLVPA